MLFIKANKNKKHMQHYYDRVVRHFKLIMVNFWHYTNTFSHP
jgi:hypothetical protein